MNRKDYQHQWYMKNSERLKDKTRKYRAEHLNWKKEYDRNYRITHLSLLREHARIYRSNPINKARNIEYQKRWYQENKQRHKELNTLWIKNNKYKHMEQIRKHYNERRKMDLNFKFATNLRARVRLAIKNKSKTGSTIEYLGCSIKETLAHIEKQFKMGMSWKNWSFRGWHPDHIVPLSSFDLTDVEQAKKAFHYTNLQPLWASENRSKFNKIL